MSVEVAGLEEFDPNATWRGRVTVKCGSIKPTRSGEGYMLQCEIISAPEEIEQKAIGMQFSEYVNPQHEHPFVRDNALSAIKAFKIDSGDSYDPDDFVGKEAEAGFAPGKGEFNEPVTVFKKWLVT